MIRTARADELQSITRLAIDVFGPTFPFPVDEEVVCNSLAMILFGNGYLRVAEVDCEVVGLLAGVVSAAGPWTRELCASELMFAIHPKHRSSELARCFLRDFERWAESLGCAMVAMGCETELEGARVGRLYERAGYLASETVYRKRIG